MKIAVLEDRPKDAALLKDMTKRYFSTLSVEVELEVSHTVEEFLRHFKPGECSIAFIDCFLDAEHEDYALVAEQTTGVDVARQIRAHDASCHIIFITTSRDFAVESYEVRADNYLVKPISYERLAQALDSLRLPEITPQLVRIGKHLEFDANDLVWTRSAGHYLELHFLRSEPKRVRMSFTCLQQALADRKQFHSPARGYLVNLNFVTKISQGEFVLREGSRVPISRRSMTQARTAWASWRALAHTSPPSLQEGS